MTDTAELYRRFHQRDPLLFARLYAGDPMAVRAMARFLRLTPLPRLAQHREALVDVLAAMPELHGPLRRTWEMQDATLTALLFGWAERTRTRLQRAA